MSRFSAMRSEWTSKSLELPKETSSSLPRAGELGPGTEPCRTRQAPLRCPQSLVGVSHCCCEVGPHGGWKMDKMTSKGPRVMWLPWWGQTGTDRGGSQGPLHPSSQAPLPSQDWPVSGWKPPRGPAA